MNFKGKDCVIHVLQCFARRNPGETEHMQQCVPGSLFSTHTRELWKEARAIPTDLVTIWA